MAGKVTTVIGVSEEELKAGILHKITMAIMGEFIATHPQARQIGSDGQRVAANEAIVEHELPIRRANTYTEEYIVLYLNPFAAKILAKRLPGLRKIDETESTPPGGIPLLTIPFWL